MEAAWKELRYGVRMLARNPAFTAVTVFTLALGIGANTAVFSIVNSLLLKPLPVKNPQQITVLTYSQKHGPLNDNFSIADFRDLRSQTSAVFSDLLGYQIGLDGLSFEGKADRIVTNYVSGNFFSALGLQPAAGRLIHRGEGEVRGMDPVLVLSYAYWQARFANDRSVIGRKILVNGRPLTIVGVAPRGFHGLYQIVETQAYLPLGMAGIENYPSDLMENRGIRNVFAVGRLRPGVDIAQAQALLNIVGKRLAQGHPETEKDLSFQLFPELRARPSADPSNTTLIIAALFLALSALVLLLACVNVANILPVRATVRQREMAIRVALGAAPRNLIRQMLTESALLGICGGIAGVLLGYWASRSLSSLHLATDLPLRLDFGFDWRVFSYAFGAALLTGVIVGLAPALRASRGDLNQVLHAGGRGSVAGRHRLRSLLVTAQVAVSLTLLIVAGLFTRSLAEVQRVHLGFDASHVANFSMDPTEIGYSDAQGRAFFDEVLGRVKALPGVQSASLANSIPMGYYNNDDNVMVPGYRPASGEPAPMILYNVITPGYFSTMEIRLLSGRPFTDADNKKAVYTAIISDAMSKKFWPKQDPIGQEFRIASDPKKTLRVVPIVSDIRFSHPTGQIQPFFYLPLAQHYESNSLETLQVRTYGNPGAIIPEIERGIHPLAPNLPVFDVKTMTEALYTLNGMLEFQVGAGLAGALGILGLVLAVVGVYGVISYAAAQQTHEIGLRMALGAKPTNILQRMLGQGMLTIGAGLIIGLVITVASASVVGNFLIISPTDPLTYASVTALLTVVALFACYVPARRAMRVDPMVALRYD